MPHTVKHRLRTVKSTKAQMALIMAMSNSPCILRLLSTPLPICPSGQQHPTQPSQWIRKHYGDRTVSTRLLPTQQRVWHMLTTVAEIVHTFRVSILHLLGLPISVEVPMYHLSGLAIGPPSMTTTTKSIHTLHKSTPCIVHHLRLRPHSVTCQATLHIPSFVPPC